MDFTWGFQMDRRVGGVVRERRRERERAIGREWAHQAALLHLYKRARGMCVISSTKWIAIGAKTHRAALEADDKCLHPASCPDRGFESKKAPFIMEYCHTLWNINTHMTQLLQNSCVVVI